jgi:hypothetical protein
VSRAGRDYADDVVSDTFLVAWRRFDAVPFRDAKGRTGAAISHTSQVSEDGKVRSVKTRLVIDPESGALLSQEQGPGTSVLLDARFSDDAPPRPR